MIVHLPGTRLLASLLIQEERHPDPCDWLLFGPDHPDIVEPTMPELEIALLAAE